MRRIASKLALCLALTLVFAACGEKNKREENKPQQVKQQDDKTDTDTDTNTPKTCPAGKGGANCDECLPGFFGADCKPCTCKNGACQDGKDGNGQCSSCKEGWLGDNCDKEVCTKQDTKCNSNNRNCVECAQDGTLKAFICEEGTTCAQDNNGTLSCEEVENDCDHNKFGSNCEPCTCDTEHGTCNDGKNGDGQCSSCKEGWLGDNCDIEVTCDHGELNPANGHCKQCNGNFVGEDCDECKDNFAGEDCNICVTDYYGTNCQNKCNCNSLQECDDGVNGLGCQCKNNKLGQNCDIDTVVISDQTWTAKNMDTTIGNDGSSLTCYANIQSFPEGDYNFIKNYGCLYKWADALKVCPTGWHLPSEQEFESLLSVAQTNDDSEMPNPAFLALVSKNSVWTHSYTEQVTNSTTFGALPAGYKIENSYYYDFGFYAYFWSATKSSNGDLYAQGLLLGSGHAYVSNYLNGSAFSVRCVRNSP